MTIRYAEYDYDSKILEGLASRNPAAMVSLYDRYGPLVYSVVIRVLRNSAEAEEVVQEVFLRIWNRAHLFDCSRGKFSTWIVTVARNLAVDSIRREGNRGFRVDPALCDALIAADDFKTKEQLDSVRAFFCNLTPEQRIVIEFAYFEGLTQIEIADRMRKPLGTVKTWTRTALRTLKQSVTEGVPQTTYCQGVGTK